MKIYVNKNKEQAEMVQYEQKLIDVHTYTYINGLSEFYVVIFYFLGCVSDLL